MAREAPGQVLRVAKVAVPLEERAAADNGLARAEQAERGAWAVDSGQALEERAARPVWVAGVYQTGSRCSRR